MADMTDDDVTAIIDGGTPSADETPSPDPDVSDGEGETPPDDGENGEGKLGEDEPAPAPPKKVQIAPPPGKEKETPAEPDEFADLEELDDFKDPTITPETKPEDGSIPTPESAIQLHKSLKEKFPEVLKQFPQLRPAIFKAGQYEQFYPTVQDAAEGAARQAIYDKMEVEVSKGNIAPIVNVLKKNSPEALKTLAMNFMENLGDPGLQNLAAEPVIRGALESMLQDAQNTGNKNLGISAKYAINWLYGVKDGRIPPKAQPKPDPQLTQREQDLSSREQAIAEQSFRIVQDPIVQETTSSLHNYIKKHIDPEKKMTEFTRDAAVNRVYDELMELMKKDGSHMQRITRMWAQIRQNPSLAASLGPEIRRAVAGSAKPHLPTLISAARAKALGVTGKQPQRQPENTKNRNTALTGGGGRGIMPKGGEGKPANLGGIRSNQIDFDRTSEDDILDGKVTLKRQSR